LEYIGCNDFQVKIRGYTIKQREIENAILGYEGIKQSIVVAKEQKDGNQYLICYYVSETKVDENKIVEYLESRLPGYAIPSVLRHLEKLPLTIDGKLNRKALPEPECARTNSYVAPRSELENKMCQIWAELLGLPQDTIGIRDNFFELGANSFLTIRLVSNLSKLNIHLSIIDIFKHKTIERLVHYLSLCNK